MAELHIHTLEHLDERRLMVQWCADYLDSNRTVIITPYEYGNKARYKIRPV